MNSFFYSYAGIAGLLFLGSLFIILILAIFLAKIFNKNWIFFAVVLISGVFFYSRGMIATALFYIGLAFFGFLISFLLRRSHTKK